MVRAYQQGFGYVCPHCGTCVLKNNDIAIPNQTKVFKLNEAFEHEFDDNAYTKLDVTEHMVAQCVDCYRWLDMRDTVLYPGFMCDECGSIYVDAPGFDASKNAASCCR